MPKHTTPDLRGNLRDNLDGTCNCKMIAKNTCFFTDGFDGRCDCKCHYPKKETPTPTELEGILKSYDELVSVPVSWEQWVAQYEAYRNSEEEKRPMTAMEVNILEQNYNSMILQRQRIKDVITHTFNEGLKLGEQRERTRVVKVVKGMKSKTHTVLVKGKGLVVGHVTQKNMYLNSALNDLLIKLRE